MGAADKLSDRGRVTSGHAERFRSGIGVDIEPGVTSAASTPGWPTVTGPCFHTSAPGCTRR
jgi:hypothetical protein